MDWIAGLERAIEYIEENLTDDIDYAEVAKMSYSSSYHFQRVFSVLCGFTLGEYIRNRRLTLAGSDLKNTDIKVIDAAIKYGYENPDSFSRAFTNFHGINPSRARENCSELKSFSRLHLKLTLEGGNIMNYRIEEKEERIYTGYARHFSGVPGNRWEQENDFFVHTRANQYLLQGIADDRTEIYNIITDIDDDGYDFYIAALLPDHVREHIEQDSVLGKQDAKRFEMIEVPQTTYAIFETEKARFPTHLHMDLRRRIISEWLPSSGYELANGAEIALIHWYKKPHDQERYIELWIPIIKKA